MSVNILGISAFYHDSAAALICDGNIVAAAQEERFTRVKHDAVYPKNAIDYVLEEGGLSLGEVDYIVFYDKPFLKFERLLETYISSVPRGFQSFRMAMPIWLREKLFQKNLLLDLFKKQDKTFNAAKLMFSEHHVSHAASAFYPSPFEKALILTLDGVGEWATTTVAIGDGNRIDIVKELHFPHSLGLLYSAFTYFAGFKVNAGEYKLMGLAPYGEPIYRDLILNHMIDLKADGSFRLDQSYFNYSTGLTMISGEFERLFGQPARKPESEKLDQFYMDVAASIQAVTEEVMLRMARHLAAEFDIPNICLAGGVALNCVANGKLVSEKIFERVWIQPAAGDAGGAIGAALACWHAELGNPRKPRKQDSMQGSYLGPSFDQETIEKDLKTCGAHFSVVSDDDELIQNTATALSQGKAVGWFQGRMEFGPRALGNRSILGDPRSSDTQKTLNLKIKFRESFRPFAPSVLRENVSEWFELVTDSPYMLLVANVKGSKFKDIAKRDADRVGLNKLNVVRSQIPAVTHVDYSARVQTVHQETNPRYHALIKAFEEKTGCPILVNTSFNVRGEPIVGSPKDAFHCFMGTHMDILVIGNCVLEKAKQNMELAENYRDKYELD